MVISNSYELSKSNLKVGDTVWACAYKLGSDVESMRYIQRPIKGVLTTSKDKKNNDNFMALGETDTGYIQYFVPYKKNGVDLSWSKAVSIYSRKIATTEEEAISLYNKLIDDYVEYFTEKIEEIKKDKI